MKEKILLIWKHLKQGTLKKMWKQTLWIYQYGRRYWKAMILYTLLGLVGTGVSLVSSLISRDLVDIVTGHQTGKLISTFAAMIGFSVANILVSQASGYASTFINLKVDSEIKNDIFAKMLVTDWESLTDYHTGDLVTRWSSDASNISSGILNWIPNLIIYTFRFISALAIVLYYDPTFALFALLGIPFSALLSKPLLKRMRDNNQRSAAMNAKLYGFNQEALSFCFLNVIIRLFRTLFLNRRIITGIRTDTMNNTTSDPVKIDLEQLLREGNIIRIKPQGYSMYPLFIPGRDEALIQQTDGTDCHRNDVVLYRRDQGILVLHRICRITSDGFYMVGDNQCEVEGPLRQDQIIGKLIAVNRNSREFTVGNPFYKFVSSLWLFMLPVRPFCFKLSAFLRKLHHS